METRTRLGGVWKLCRVVSRRVVLEDDGKTGSAAHELFISDTAREDTHQPSRREIVSINDRRLVCREEFKATTAEQERALQRLQGVNLRTR